MLNWTHKESVMGGIYHKPTLIAKPAHIFIGGMALIKGLTANPDLLSMRWIVAIIYLFLAVMFAWLFYRSPAVKKQ